MQEEVTEVFRELQHPERDKPAVRSGGGGAREAGAVALPDPTAALERGKGDDLARDSGAAHADAGQEEPGGAGKHAGEVGIARAGGPDAEGVFQRSRADPAVGTGEPTARDGGDGEPEDDAEPTEREADT